MSSEEILKSISEILNKHKDFLNDNPEMLYVIEHRLYKAIDDEDEEDFGDESFGDMFDQVPEDEEGFGEDVTYQDINEEDDASKFLAEAENKQEAEPVAPKEEKKKISASGYRDWAPKDKYEDNHQESIDKLMGEGWSHREAERLIGQHEMGGDPRQSKIRPSEPSAKMFESVKGSAGDYLKNYERQISDNADARKNPVKFANSQNRKAHEEAHGDFSDAFSEFKNSDEVKELRGRDRHNAIKDFKAKWQDSNPDHQDKSIGVAANTAGSFDRAKEERTQHLQEGEKAIAEAGMVGGGSTSSEFSTAASGGQDMTRQGAMQSVGGSQNEGGGFSAGTIKDPSLHIAEQYPEYAQHLKDKHAKLNDALSHPTHADKKERYTGIKSIIKKKGEA